MASLRTPLGRARGMGSAKHGVSHFIAQRVTAAALVLLIAWGVFAALGFAKGDYDTATQWLRSPLNAGLSILLVIAAFWHMSLGMRVIVEDYIHKASSKALLLLLNIFICWLGAALTVLALLKVALAAGVSV